MTSLKWENYKDFIKDFCKGQMNFERLFSAQAGGICWKQKMSISQNAKQKLRILFTLKGTSNLQ